MYDVDSRKQKGKKTLSVIKEYLSVNLKSLSLLDIGCSTGYLSWVYSTAFGSVVAVDIDERAIIHAKGRLTEKNLHFSIADSMHLPFQADTFDVITCSHIYEHVPDSEKLISEIFRVLRPGGVCYFAAGNRIQLIEAHYRLPLLSVLPKPLGNLYMRLSGRGSEYYETHRTVWGLRKLVSRFEIIDYTGTIINNPHKFHAEELLQNHSRKQMIAKLMVRGAYWLIPTYIWLLKKPLTSRD